MTKLIFYKKSHTYKYGKEKLISVTAFLGSFFSKFDTRGIARKLAKFKVNREAKRGVRYWLAKWKEASAHGTRVHRAMEEYITNTNTPFEMFCSTQKDIDKATQGIGWLEAWLSTTFTRARRKKVELLSEYQIYDTDLGLAGTIDLMINDNNKVWLVDWKTNKKIDKEGYKGQKALEPIENLDDCNYNKYALQLSLYSYILKKKGYSVQKCYLVHMREDSVMPYEINPTHYYEYIKEMIKWQKDKKSQQ